ncbi:unnamed protein product [Symbiodinium pilosum]|uniref:BART domain-containing protein n=1 Tax=Symbiodinium pilosum TaxID=2952 RepID=A0A812QHL0_SYMPI|nr:unnamed protein product [Symbiodinium pilosum]
MNEAAACRVDWQLSPFLRGFCEAPFAAEINEFIQTHASAFRESNLDGSHPLRWTELHKEYAALFERQLQAVVQEEGFSLEDFRDHIAELREFAAQRAPEEYLPGCEPSFIPPGKGIRVEEFWDFLEALTASKNFESFKEVMCAAARRPKKSPEACGYTRSPAAEEGSGYRPSQPPDVDELGTPLEPPPPPPD